MPGVIGVGYLLLRDWRKGLLLGPFPFLYLLAVSYLGQTYPRNGYLSVVMLVPPAAYLLDGLVGWVARQVESRKLKVESRSEPQSAGGMSLRPASGPIYFSLTAFLLLLLLFLPLRQTLNWDSYLSQRDGAFLAQDWMEQQQPLGKRFVAELHPWQFLAWPDVIAVYIQGSSQPPITSQPPAYYANLGYDYAMLSSVNDKQRTYDPNDHLKEYQALPKVISFPGDHTGGKGPDLTVYQLGKGFAQRHIQTRIEANFGSLATLRGYEFGPVGDSSKMFVYNPQAHPAIERGKLLGVNLFFQAAQPDGRDLTLFLHLNAPDGSTVSHIDVPTRYGATIPHPTSQWHAGEYIIGSYSLPLAANAPSGSYTLELGLYDSASRVRLPINGNGLTVKDNALIISGIEIK